MTPEALRLQMAALRRQQRQARRQAVSHRVGSIHRQWWYAGAAIVALSAGAVGCQRWQTAETQRTALVAQAVTAQAAPPTTAPAPVESMPNPLETLQLTGQAAWMIGTTADGQLAPNRSAAVIAAMLQQVDPCKLFVGLDDRAALVVAREPRPGFVPLVNCPAAPSTTTTAKAAAT